MLKHLLVNSTPYISRLNLTSQVLELLIPKLHRRLHIKLSVGSLDCYRTKKLISHWRQNFEVDKLQTPIPAAKLYVIDGREQNTYFQFSLTVQFDPSWLCNLVTYHNSQRKWNTKMKTREPKNSCRHTVLNLETGQ